MPHRAMWPRSRPLLRPQGAVLAIVIEAVAQDRPARAQEPGHAGACRRCLRRDLRLRLHSLSWFLSAGLIGSCPPEPACRSSPAAGGTGAHGACARDADAALGEALPAHARPGLTWSLRVAASASPLARPVLLLLLTLGPANVFSHIALFSWMAVVTSAAPTRSWPMSPRLRSRPLAGSGHGEMLDGLAWPRRLRAADHGLQFVGFMAPCARPSPSLHLLAAGAGRHPHHLVHFVPCFLWIFAGAPFVETLRYTGAGRRPGAITASVVGVILNLAVGSRSTPSSPKCASCIGTVGPVSRSSRP